MTYGQADHLTQYGLRLLGHGRPVLGFHGAEVTIDETYGQLADPNAAKGRKDVLIDWVRLFCSDGRSLIQSCR